MTASGACFCVAINDIAVIFPHLADAAMTAAMTAASSPAAAQAAPVKTEPHALGHHVASTHPHALANFV